MKTLTIYILTILLFFISPIKAQTDTANSVKFYPGFKFTEGVYLNHQQLVNNKPVLKNHIVTKYNRYSFEFFDNLLLEPIIEYYDQFGLLNTIETNNIWGFCRLGSVFINFGNDFCRIPVIGNICHFVATITVYDERYNQPYMNYPYGTTPTTTSRTEIQQFIMDFKTGKILEYTTQNVEQLLMPDTELYTEYKKLKNKKKRDLKFLYIRKYNEKHPLYIPNN